MKHKFITDYSAQPVSGYELFLESKNNDLIKTGISGFVIYPSNSPNSCLFFTLTVIVYMTVQLLQIGQIVRRRIIY